MTTPIGIPPAKPRARPVPKPDRSAPAVPREKPEAADVAADPAVSMPSRGAIYLEPRPGDRQRSEAFASTTAPAVAAASGWAEVEQMQTELISIQAEVEAAERILEAARLLPCAADWPHDVKRLPNAELGRPFSEFDEDLAGDRIEGRHDWIRLKRPRDLHRTGPWADPFAETRLRRTGGDRRPTVTEPALPPGAEAPVESAPASKGLSPEDRAAFRKKVEDFTARKLEGLFEGRTATTPEWVRDSADWIRETDRDHPEVRPIVKAVGAALSLPRKALVDLFLDDEQAAEYARFMERVAEYEELTKDAVNRSIETFGRKKGLSEDDIDDLKLVASTGIFAAAAAIGGRKLPKKRRHEGESHEPAERDNESSIYAMSEDLRHTDAERHTERRSADLSNSVSKEGGELFSRRPTSFDPVDQRVFYRIQQAFARHGKTIDSSEEALRYLELRKAEGLTFNAETILIRPNASPSTLFEELIHATQHRKGLFDLWSSRYGTAEAIVKAEYEAAIRLVKNQRAYSISDAENEVNISRAKEFGSRLKKMGVPLD